MSGYEMSPRQQKLRGRWRAGRQEGGRWMATIRGSGVKMDSMTCQVSLLLFLFIYFSLPAGP